MTYAAQVTWDFRGKHRIGVMLHAENESHAWARLFTILPSTVFRAEDWEIVLVDSAKLLCTQNEDDCSQTEYHPWTQELAA